MIAPATAATNQTTSNLKCKTCTTLWVVLETFHILILQLQNTDLSWNWHAKLKIFEKSKHFLFAIAYRCVRTLLHKYINPCKKYIQYTAYHARRNLESPDLFDFCIGLTTDDPPINGNKNMNTSTHRITARKPSLRCILGPQLSSVL